jgi:putative membrane protein
MWGYGYSPSWGGMFLMMVLGNLLWIALLGILVWAVIRWFVRRPGILGPRESGSFAGGPSALEILRQRYARGEIDAVTFEQMRERLEGSEVPGTNQSTKNQQSVPTR